jgi:hypothetical protein
VIFRQLRLDRFWAEKKTRRKTDGADTGSRG